MRFLKKCGKGGPRSCGLWRRNLGASSLATTLLGATAVIGRELPKNKEHSYRNLVTHICDFAMLSKPNNICRCTRQLYERLGPGAAVEVTCVEVQGDEVVDLLNSRAAPLSFSRLTAAAESTNGFNSTSSSSAIGCGSPGPTGHTNSPATGFSRSPIAAAAVSAYRRRPLSLVVALSLPEALASLEVRLRLSNRRIKPKDHRAS